VICEPATGGRAGVPVTGQRASRSIVRRPHRRRPSTPASSEGLNRAFRVEPFEELTPTRPEPLRQSITTPTGHARRAEDALRQQSFGVGNFLHRTRCGNGNGWRPLGLPATWRIAASSSSSQASVMRTGMMGRISASSWRPATAVEISAIRWFTPALSASRCTTMTSTAEPTSVRAADTREPTSFLTFSEANSGRLNVTVTSRCRNSICTMSANGPSEVPSATKTPEYVRAINLRSRTGATAELRAGQPGRPLYPLRRTCDRPAPPATNAGTAIAKARARSDRPLS
jgi:hypothetical protein